MKTRHYGWSGTNGTCSRLLTAHGYHSHSAGELPQRNLADREFQVASHRYWWSSVLLHVRLGGSRHVHNAGGAVQAWRRICDILKKVHAGLPPVARLVSSHIL